jgi:hypothetical protein
MKFLASALMALGMLSSANAALYPRAGGTMVYDDVLNVTWIADMNYAVTSDYVINGTPYGSTYSTDAVWTDGSMGWNAAKLWAANLVYGGYSDWRLPLLDRPGTDCLYLSCSGGELGHLFAIDLGNKNTSILDQTGDSYEQQVNLALFSNVQIAVLWYGTESTSYPDQAFVFAPLFGNESRTRKDSPFHAMAVRDGDVANVPAPATIALLALGLVGIGTARRKQVVSAAPGGLA